MKTRKLNKRDKWRLHEAIWNVYQAEKLVVTDVYERQKEVAQKILAKYPEISIDLLEVITPDTVLKFLEKKVDVVTADEFWLFDEMVLYAMRNVLNKHEPVISTFKYEKPRRMTSPPFEAYYQVGHSALNIGPGRIPDNQMRQMKRPYR